MNSIYLPALIGFVITALLTPLLIPLLKRLKFGQTIRDEGPSWHQKKSGTPTMGGIAFIVASVVACLIFAKGDIKLYIAVLTVFLFGLIGFVDDFIKVVLKRNLGLNEKQKLVGQTLFSILFLLTAYHFGIIDTSLLIPFTSISLELGWFYFVFATFLMVGFVNAVNLTDGVDGLAASVTMVVAIFFALFATRLEATSVAILSASVSGGLFGFLFFNYNPAKVFMGDTGSLFLGAFVSVAAILTGYELLLLLAGLIYLIEALSVMIQVAYFKKTRKRIFLMTPIHHHFEKKGWNEKKIVFVFSLVTIICCAIAFFA